MSLQTHFEFVSVPVVEASIDPAESVLSCEAQFGFLF